MPKADCALNIGADSTHTTNPVPVFTPASGELTYPGGRIALPFQRARALTMLIAANGEVVTHADLDTLFGPAVEKAPSRRQLMTQLKYALEPAGLSFEHRRGFGYRLIGRVELRMPQQQSKAAEALAALNEVLPPRASAHRRPPKYLRDLTAQQLADLRLLTSRGYRTADALAKVRAEKTAIRVPTAAELEKRGPLHGLTERQADDRYKLLRNGQHVVAEVIAAADRAANEARQ